MPKSTELNTLPLRLLEVRKSAGISQAKCAARIEVSDRSYKLYELGKREIPLSVLFRFSEAMKTDVVWLMTGQGTSENTRPRPELLRETIAVIVRRIDPEISAEEAVKWGKKGEFIFGLAEKNGNSPSEEARVIFDTFE